MIVEVVGGADEVPEVRVEDVDDLTRLHLAVGAVTDEEGDAALRTGGLGRLVGGDTRPLDGAAPRAGAETPASAPTRAPGFPGLLGPPEGKGWAAGDGAVPP